MRAYSTRVLRPSRQGIVVSAVLLLATAGALVVLARSADQPVYLGFWFEPVSLGPVETARLGGAPTDDELGAMAIIAVSEVRRAFSGLRVIVSDRRDAMYRVRVVSEIRDLRFKRAVYAAGQSRAIRGIGGQGEVSFRFLAAGAMNHAPSDAQRTAIVEAVGRGIGRSAVHEFVHQLLPLAQIHDSADVASYEYRSASRREQYYGDMHWDIAGPWLEAEFGLAGSPEGLPHSAGRTGH